uniref:Uncharacterized protein n=1 Tax=Anguilla anguilla TaxID=7936 RepID=A0A0E9WX66_ANGAN
MSKSLASGVSQTPYIKFCSWGAAWGNVFITRKILKYTQPVHILLKVFKNSQDTNVPLYKQKELTHSHTVSQDWCLNYSKSHLNDAQEERHLAILKGTSLLKYPIMFSVQQHALGQTGDNTVTKISRMLMLSNTPSFNTLGSSTPKFNTVLAVTYNNVRGIIPWINCMWQIAWLPWWNRCSI